MRRVLLLVCLSSIVATAPAAAATILDRSVFSAAGGASTSGIVRLEVLAGDIAVGPSADGTRELWHGFWAPLPTPPVSVPDRASVAFLATPAPNPALRFAHIRFGIPRAGRVAISVHDVAGRTLRGWTWSSLDAGAHDVGWDLRDDGGRRLSTGVYWLRFESDAFQATRKLVVLGGE